MSVAKSEPYLLKHRNLVRVIPDIGSAWVLPVKNGTPFEAFFKIEGVSPATVGKTFLPIYVSCCRKLLPKAVVALLCRICLKQEGRG